jgi:aryl-alcohol dehydrogenase-like predicted oxidoreductase
MSQHITSLDTYRLLGRSGLRASPLTLGTMTFAPNWVGARSPGSNPLNATIHSLRIEIMKSYQSANE